MDAPRALLQTADVVIKRQQPKKDEVLAVEPEQDILVSSSWIALWRYARRHRCLDLQPAVIADVAGSRVAASLEL